MASAWREPSIEQFVRRTGIRLEVGALRVTQHNHPLVSLLALALVLAAGFLSAAAQSGSEAVVCVGSETRTLQTNPIRRVYTEDMEVVYRIGVDIGQRDQMESNLRSERGAYPEVVRLVGSRGRSCRDRQLHGRHSPGSDRGPGGPEYPKGTPGHQDAHG